MSKELDQILISTIQKATDATGKAIDFASDQAPDVINQLLTYKLWENISVAVFCFIILFAYVKGFKKVKEYDEDAIPPYLAVGCLVMIVPLLLGLSSIIEAIQIAIAPKLFLIEYAAGLIKGH